MIHKEERAKEKGEQKGGVRATGERGGEVDGA